MQKRSKGNMGILMLIEFRVFMKGNVCLSKRRVVLFELTFVVCIRCELESD